GGGYRGNHASPVQANSFLMDQDPSGGDQDGAGPVKSGVDCRENVVIHRHQAAGTVLLRLAITNPAMKTSTVNPVKTAMEGHRVREVGPAFSGNKVSCSASRP